MFRQRRRGVATRVRRHVWRRPSCGGLLRARRAGGVEANQVAVSRQPAYRATPIPSSSMAPGAIRGCRKEDGGLPPQARRAQGMRRRGRPRRAACAAAPPRTGSQTAPACSACRRWMVLPLSSHGINVGAPGRPLNARCRPPPAQMICLESPCPLPNANNSSGEVLEIVAAMVRHVPNR